VDLSPIRRLRLLPCFEWQLQATNSTPTADGVAALDFMATLRAKHMLGYVPVCNLLGLIPNK
jgi:hypothetical protein